MKRRLFLGTASMSLLTIAGCASSEQDGTATPKNTDTPSPTDSPTPSESPVSSEKVTTFESLPEKGKELFLTILKEGSIEEPSDKIPSTLWEAEYVQYEGEVYSLSRTDTHRNVADYSVSVGQTEESEVDESKLVNYTDLSPDTKDAFKQMLSGSYPIRESKLPGKLDDGGFVKYERDYYEISIVHGDTRVFEISATKVNG
jgi:hypothetical protein